jgi:tetratricopeptide (TPR) repeat protein
MARAQRGGNMRHTYDDLGFPIPKEFESPPQQRRFLRESSGSSRFHRVKRIVILLVVLGAVLPAIVLPELVPFAKQTVVRWSLERAFACEARDDVAGAVRELERAVAWHGDDASLLAARATLRLESGDPDGALLDADRAVSLAPARTEPYRVRAIVHVCGGRAEEALSDAAMVVDLAGEENDEAVNLQAYVRGLVGQDISEAVADIERLIARLPAPPAEYLDTQGFLRHLTGRHQDALQDMNEAIGLMQVQRRQMMLLAGRVDRLELLQRMRSLDHAMAVMFHHRGLVLEALGLLEQARDDFEIARRKGFAPERGIL